MTIHPSRHLSLSHTQTSRPPKKKSPLSEIRQRAVSRREMLDQGLLEMQNPEKGDREGREIFLQVLLWNALTSEWCNKAVSSSFRFPSRMLV